MTPEDREMLEMAARAAGILIEDYKGVMAIIERDGDECWRTGVYWDPLASDGDALRLAAQLGICVHVHPLNIGATKYGAATYLGDWRERTLDDAADYRLAITRAAAAIGRSMP
jgi:hypothetical protein